MGVWFLANFVANWLAGQLSALMGEFASLGAFFSIFIDRPDPGRASYSSRSRRC